jgi:hypothetical protein
VGLICFRFPFCTVVRGCCWDCVLDGTLCVTNGKMEDDMGGTCCTHSGAEKYIPG